MKNKIKIMSLMIFIGMKTISIAQQDPMYSMYIFDKMLINPAFTGSSPWAVGTIKSREQFIGLAGRPSTQTLNFHSPIQSKNIGVGGKIVRDKIAIMNNFSVTADVSYHLNFAKGKLSLGLEGGILSRSTDFSNLVVSQLGDKAILEAGVSKSVVPDFSMGAYYQKKQFYCGIAAYHVIRSKFKFGTAVDNSRLSSFANIIIGNVFTLSKSLTCEPSMLIKYQGNSVTQVDINSMLYYDSKFGLGLQYRTKDAFVVMAKCNISESLRIAYSYDITVSKFSKYSKGAHEIMVSYGIKLPPPPTQKEIHPRYYF